MLQKVSEHICVYNVRVETKISIMKPRGRVNLDRNTAKVIKNTSNNIHTESKVFLSWRQIIK